MFRSVGLNKLQAFPLILFIFIVACIIIILADRSDVTFQFPEYDYKETSKNVRSSCDVFIDLCMIFNKYSIIVRLTEYNWFS